MPERYDLIAELRRANPIPDPETLTLPGGPQERHHPERSAPMADTKSQLETRSDPPNRRRFAKPSVVMATLAAVLVLGLGAVFLIRDGAVVASPSDPTEVARSYFQNLTNADQVGWWALFADDASARYEVNGQVMYGKLADQETRAALQSDYDYITITGGTHSDVNCTLFEPSDNVLSGDAVYVICTYSYKSLITEVMDVALKGAARFEVQDGKIIELNHDIIDFAPVREVPVTYMKLHHPDEYSALCEVPNNGAACAQLMLDNLDGISLAWDELTKGAD